VNWTCEWPGYWVGSDGTNTATAVRLREGIIHGSEWMWSTKINGEWITNANSLADAKQAVAEYQQQHNTIGE